MKNLVGLSFLVLSQPFVSDAKSITDQCRKDTADIFFYTETNPGPLVLEAMVRNVTKYSWADSGTTSRENLCKDKDPPCEISYGDASDYMAKCKELNGTFYTASTRFGCKKESSFAGFQDPLVFAVKDMPACIGESCESDSYPPAFDVIVDLRYRTFAGDLCTVAMGSSSASSAFSAVVAASATTLVATLGFVAFV